MNMFCPKCGRPDQSAETYCRNCGLFLPDISKTLVSITKPEQHVTANLILGSMTVVTSFTLAILLYVFFLGLPAAPPVIYVMFGLLLAMGIWHIQTVWRSLLLRRHFKEADGRKEAFNSTAQIGTATSDLQLSEAQDGVFEPPSVVERTTRQLAER